MSPLSVRRFRAERMLRREFQAMRGGVLASVRGKLRAAGVSIDGDDLDACYAQAWHGLYVAMLEGGAEIANPAGWLVTVTYRRAIDEQRARRAARALAEGLSEAHPTQTHERDLAGELDDRERLRQLLEGLRGRLSARERQAAALCYLQGLSRADAAACMRISEARMRKLMDGSRAGAPGVAAKVGELLYAIRAGSYCAEQASLMRALAFGILDPGGERHSLAHAHYRSCPACRSYVLSLRGLAAILPPAPLALVLGAAGTAGAGVAAGAGGGGWVLAGSGVGAKLAVGCVLAVGVGAGCAALTGVPSWHPPVARPHHRVHHLDRAPGSRPATDLEAESLATPAALHPAMAGALGATATNTTRPGAGSVTRSSRVESQASAASREFGLEQSGGVGGASAAGASAAAAPPTRSSGGDRTEARIASATASESAGSAASPSAPDARAPSSSAPGPSTPGSSAAGSGSRSSSSSAAEREFGI